MKTQLLVLHLGSNMGDRLWYLHKALELLKLEFGKLIKISSVYQTEAWGVKEQADFLNMAIIYQSRMEPLNILKKIKDIEKKLGRMERKIWHQREIDIDIILYGNIVLNLPNLTIPHPHMNERNFVLAPLNEICPEYINPVLNKTISELFKASKDRLNVELWKNL